MIGGVLAFLGALFVIVLLHEAGHLLAAKRVGMPASVFSVGFGPRLCGFHWRGTEYRLSAIPLGGYVRIDPMEEIVEGRRGPVTLFETWPMKARLLVISAGILVNILLAVAIYVALPLAWGVAPTPEPRIAAVDVASLPDGAVGWASLPRDARIVAVDGRPVAQWRDLYLALAGSGPGLVTLSLEGGARHQVAMPAGDEGKLGVLGALRRAEAPTLAGPPPVLAAGPVPGADVRPGDRVVAVNGVAVRSWTTWRSEVERAAAGGDVHVLLLREGSEHIAVLAPDVARTLQRRDLRRRVGVGGAVRDAGANFAGTLTVVKESWSILFSGALSARQLSGPVSMAHESIRIFSSGWEPFLRFVAFLSLNIAIVNALPIPALDGGFVALMGIEALLRRPIPVPLQAYLGRVGVIWLCLVMAGTLVNDLVRLTGM